MYLAFFLIWGLSKVNTRSISILTPCFMPEGFVMAINRLGVHIASKLALLGLLHNGLALVFPKELKND